MDTATTTNGQANGKPQEFDKQKALTSVYTEGYRPTVPLTGLWTLASGAPVFTLYNDIEFMLTHPIVRSSLNYFKSGIAGAEFDVKCESQEIGKFILEQYQRYWDRGVPLLQGGYEYGWIGCEAVYSDDENTEGNLKWDSFKQFAPRDVFLLTQDNKPVGIRVKNVRNKPGPVDLWMASEDIPAKGIWYAHQPRWSSHYGQSQLYGCWRPWRRLAWKDGAEQVVDTAGYRFGVQGMIGKFPNEDMQGPAGSPTTTLDSEGNPRRYARDIMREICEQYKAGANIGLPSEFYDNGNPKWDVIVPDKTISLDPLLNWTKYLERQISYGCDVPPELLEASETGSGYSGRAIPMEAFLDRQQQIADAMCHLFGEQVMRPLVKYNWGDVMFEVKVKRLIETKRKAQAGQSPEGQPGGGQPAGAGQPAAPPGAGVPGGAAPPPPAGAGIPQFSLVSDRIREIAKQAKKNAA